MWNNNKNIPENFTTNLTSFYGYGKSVEEFMTSYGDCIVYTKVGRFTLYLDLEGEASFEYKGKTYETSDDLTPTLIQKIRKKSTELNWQWKVSLKLFLQIDENDSYHVDFPLECDVLPNPLELEVMMVRLVPMAIEEIERKKIESDSAVVGIAHLLIEEDEKFLNLFKHYRQRTVKIPEHMNPDDAVSIFYSNLENDPGLMNAVTMVKTLTQALDDSSGHELTVAWCSDNQAVNNEMHAIVSRGL